MTSTKNIDTHQDEDFEEFIFQDTILSQVKQQNTYKLMRNVQNKKQNGMKHQKSNSVHVFSQHHTHSRDHQLSFQDQIKQLYLHHSKIPPLIKGTEGMKSFDLKNCYVNLKSVIKENMNYDSTGHDEVIGEKVNIDINEIFDSLQEHDYASKILILGGAGVGKSTLMQYMAFKWSRNELWVNKFDVVYRIMLKTLLNNSWKHKYQVEKAYSVEIDKSPLKYLIHYNIQIIAEKSNTFCHIKPEDINLKEGQFAILLDGYDEIAHLQDDPTYKLIEQEIFEHQYIILTSRPNAVSNMFRQKFNRVVENNGLDRIGIQKYIEQYFEKEKQEIQNQKEDLLDLLDKNQTIYSICNIPVNLTMLCYLFTQKNDDFSRVNFYNSCQLYKQVIQKLGERFLCNHFKGIFQEGKQIDKERLETNLINLPELNVIRYLAYIGLTGGGVEIEDINRKETLIIQIYYNGRDKHGACIENSIEALNEKTTITKVLKFGLLKKEGVQKKNAQYSFIHLSFQEYLTAEYFTEKILLGSDKEKRDVLNYISTHRNDPRLLLTLKFMSGIITQQNDLEVLKDFWNSMCCNIDGVIELSLEEKVKLLMNLLGQSLKPKDCNSSQLDKRIPNLNDMVALINTVVVNNINQFKQQLKESNFVSKNIIFVIEGFMQGKDCRLEVLEKIKYSYSQNDFTVFEQIETKDKKPNLNQKMLEFIDYFYQQRKYYKTYIAQESMVMDKAQNVHSGTNVSTQRKLSLVLKGLSLAAQIPHKVNWDVFERSLIQILESNENSTVKKNVLNMINQLFQTQKTKESFQKQILQYILNIEKKYYDNLRKQVQQTQNNPKLISLISNIDQITENKECSICYQQNIPKSTSNSSTLERPENNLYETIINSLKLIYQTDPDIVLKWINMMMDYSIHQKLSIIPKLFQVALLVYFFSKAQQNEKLQQKVYLLIQNFQKVMLDHIDIINYQLFKQLLQQFDNEVKSNFQLTIVEKLVNVVSKKQQLNEDLFENIKQCIKSIYSIKDKDKLIKEMCQIYFSLIKMDIRRESINKEEDMAILNKYLINFAEVLSMLENINERQSAFGQTIDFFIARLCEDKEPNYKYLCGINLVDKHSLKCDLNLQQFIQLSTLIIQCQQSDIDNSFFFESISFIRNLQLNKGYKSYANYFLVALIKSLQGKQEEKITIDQVNIYNLVDTSNETFKNFLREITQNEQQMKHVKKFNYLINIILAQHDITLQLYSLKAVSQCIIDCLNNLQTISSINKLFWNFLDQLKFYKINEQILEILTQFLSIQDIHFEVVSHITKLFKDNCNRMNIPQIIQTIITIKLQMGIKLKDFSKDKNFYNSIQWQLDQIQDKKSSEELTKYVINHCQKLLASIASNKSMEISLIKEKLDILMKCILLFQNYSREGFQIEYFQLQQIVKSLVEIAKNKNIFDCIMSYILTIVQSVKELKKKSILSRECYYLINEISKATTNQQFTVSTLCIQRELIQLILLDQKRSHIINEYINSLFSSLDKYDINLIFDVLHNILTLFLLVEDNQIQNELIQQILIQLQDLQPNSINSIQDTVLDQKHPICHRLEIANNFALVFSQIINILQCAQINSWTIKNSPNGNSSGLAIRQPQLSTQKRESFRDKNISRQLDLANNSFQNLLGSSTQQEQQIQSSTLLNKNTIEKILLSILNQHNDDINNFLMTRSECLNSIIQQIDSVTNFKQIEQVIKDIIDSIYKGCANQTQSTNVESIICSLLNGINNEQKRFTIIINVLQHIICIIEQNDQQGLLKKLHMLALSVFVLIDKPNKLISDTGLKFIHCIINRRDIIAYEYLLSQKKFMKLLMLIEERDEKQIIEQLLLKFKINNETIFSYLSQWRYKMIKKNISFQEDDATKIKMINSIVSSDTSKSNIQIITAKIQLVNMTIIHKNIKNSSKFMEQIFNQDFMENTQIAIKWYMEHFSHLNKVYILLNLLIKYRHHEIKSSQLMSKFNQINHKYQLEYTSLDYENLNSQVNSNFSKMKEDIRLFSKNTFGFSYHKLIFLALNLIQFENEVYSDRKELISECKILLRNIINDLDEKGTLWIIRNVVRITSISYYGKIAFQKVIELIFKDGMLSDSNQNMKGINKYKVLTDIINCNANIQIYNKGYITIDGQKFKVTIKDESKLQIEKELSKMIRTHKNPFISQYNTYQSIFPNTSKQLIASLDRQEHSIIDSSWNYKLNLQEMNINSIWKLVELISFNGEKIVFFEKRDIFGKRLICKVDVNQNVKSVVQISDQNLLKIFGEYNGPKMFFCSLFKNPATVLKQDDVTDIIIPDWIQIDGDKAFIDQLEKFEILRKYYTNTNIYELYHDSLLQMEVTAHRIQDIVHFEFTKILKQQEFKLLKDLIRVYPKDKKIHSNFIDYYRGFVRTFCLCYQEAQIIVSDKFIYDKGNVGLNIVYQLISFIPLIEDIGNTVVQSVEEFILDRNIKKQAQTFLNFACDHSDLSEKCGKIALLIIKKTRDQLFKNQGYIEIFQQNYKHTNQNDIQKRPSFVQKTKENIKKILDQIYTLKQFTECQPYNDIYKGKYELLGNNDATQLIQIIIKSSHQKSNSSHNDFELIKNDINYQVKENKSQIFQDNHHVKQKQNCSCSIF